MPEDNAFGRITSAIGGAAGPIGAIAGAGLGLFQLFSNLKKEKEAKAQLAALKDPFYKIQDEYYQNRNIAAGEAGGGMPAATQDYYTSESQRGLSAGISGTLQSGGTANDIAKLFDVYDRGIDKTHAESADQHLKNIQYFKEANKDLAGQKTTQWAINEYQPIQEKRKQLSQNISSAEQNAYGGANTAIGSITALGTSLQNNDLLSKLFATKTQDMGAPAVTNDPYAIRSNEMGDLRGMDMPIENLPNSLAADEQAAFNNWLKNRQMKY